MLLHAENKREGYREREGPNTSKTDRDQPPTTRPQNNLTRQGGKKKQKTTRRQKKAGAGQDLSIGDEQSLRIEGVVFGRDEETQGATQTTKVWVSPAPERKKEKNRETVSANIPKKEKKRDKATDNIPTPEKNNRNIKAKNDLNDNKLAQTPTKSLGNVHCRVAGPMGRPAFWGDRGPWHRGVRRPPHHGNRPRWCKN